MKRVLAEMYRVLRPQSAAIVVVGSSIMRSQDTETHNCLAEIGKSVGLLLMIPLKMDYVS
jgi:ubiquinone/menaquinone biosynthesis C-methylase UbiE